MMKCWRRAAIFLAASCAATGLAGTISVSPASADTQPVFVSSPATVNSNGALITFGRDNGGRLWGTMRPAGGSWQTPGNITGAYAAGDPAAIIDNGVLHVFSRMGDNEIFDFTATFGWSVKSIARDAADSPSVARNPDGRLEVFYRNTAGKLAHVWQTSANGNYSGPATMYNIAIQGVPAVANNASGKLTVFARTSANSLVTLSEGITSPWTAATTIPNLAVGGSPTIGHQQNKSLDVFVRSSGGHPVHLRETAAGSGRFGAAALVGTNLMTDAIAVANNDDGREEVTYRRSDGVVVHQWQTAINGNWNANGVAYGGSLKGNAGTHASMVLANHRLDTTWLSGWLLQDATQTAPNSAFAGPKALPLPPVIVDPVALRLARVLATIRTRESGDYCEHHNPSGATGAYQYEPGTWQSQLGATIASGALPANTPRTSAAYLSPRSVQDAVAGHDVTAFLASDNDVSHVPIHWYYPAALATWPAMYNYVPPGNGISIGDYQKVWMQTYNGYAGYTTDQLNNTAARSSC